jgi:hypothetical protein
MISAPFMNLSNFTPLLQLLPNDAVAKEVITRENAYECRLSIKMQNVDFMLWIGWTQYTCQNDRKGLVEYVEPQEDHSFLWPLSP